MNVFFRIYMTLVCAIPLATGILKYTDKCRIQPPGAERIMTLQMIAIPLYIIGFFYPLLILPVVILTVTAGFFRSMKSIGVINCQMEELLNILKCVFLEKQWEYSESTHGFQVKAGGSLFDITVEQNFTTDFIVFSGTTPDYIVDQIKKALTEEVKYVHCQTHPKISLAYIFVGCFFIFLTQIAYFL